MTPGRQLSISASRRFYGWLESNNLGLAFSTYQANKVFFIGRAEDSRLSIFERTFPHCMGLCVEPDGDALWLASDFQVWRLETANTPGQSYEGYDRVYIPQVAYTTGDIDVHDIAVDRKGPVLANTLFSCLARPSERFSFEPIWKPPFISRLAAEDRCHLNGVALRDGAITYVSCLSQTDVNEGWRDFRKDGGVVLDAESGEFVAEGLSMPHSPRFHRDRLWMLNSGRGEFGYVDIQSGQFIPVTFCAGFLRGLAFYGKYAVVGLSRPRPGQGFDGLELNERIQRHNVAPRCGIQVINIETGDIEHELRVEGVVQELYDVVVLPETRRPMAVGLLTDEIRQTISMPR